MKEFILLALLTLCGLAFAQEAPASLATLLSGNLAPLRITGQELTNPGWFRFTVAGSEGSGTSTLQSMAGQMGASSIFYTRGLVVEVTPPIRYLVAYARPALVVSLQEMMERGEPLPPQPPITLATGLPLCLLDLRTIGSLKDIREVDPRQEMLADKAALNVYEEARMKALVQVSLNNLRQIAIAIMMWTQDHDEVLPPMTTAAAMRTVLKDYDGNEKLWLQPVVDEPYQPNPTLAGTALGDIRDPTTMILAYEAKPWPNGMRCVAFVDGHVEVMTEERWKAAKAKSGMK